MVSKIVHKFITINAFSSSLAKPIRSLILFFAPNFCTNSCRVGLFVGRSVCIAHRVQRYSSFSSSFVFESALFQIAPSIGHTFFFLSCCLSAKQCVVRFTSFLFKDHCLDHNADNLEHLFFFELFCSPSCYTNLLNVCVWCEKQCTTWLLFSLLHNDFTVVFKFNIRFWNQISFDETYVCWRTRNERWQIGL